MTLEQQEKEARKAQRRARFNQNHFVNDHIDQLSTAIQKQQGCTEKEARAQAETKLKAEYINAVERHADIKGTLTVVGALSAVGAMICGGAVLPFVTGAAEPWAVASLLSAWGGGGTCWLAGKAGLLQGERLKAQVAAAKDGSSIARGSRFGYWRARRRVAKTWNEAPSEPRKVKPLKLRGFESDTPRQ